MGCSDPCRNQDHQGLPRHCCTGTSPRTLPLPCKQIQGAHMLVLAGKALTSPGELPARGQGPIIKAKMSMSSVLAHSHCLTCSVDHTAHSDPLSRCSLLCNPHGTPLLPLSPLQCRLHDTPCLCRQLSVCPRHTPWLCSLWMFSGTSLLHTMPTIEAGRSPGSGQVSTGAPGQLSAAPL